jgi:hypothetical protein
LPPVHHELPVDKGGLGVPIRSRYSPRGRKGLLLTLRGMLIRPAVDTATLFASIGYPSRRLQGRVWKKRAENI